MTGADPRIVRSRRRILDATTALVLERGITGTTIEAISERSGVAKTTIYRHWSGHHDVVLAALDAMLTEPPPLDSGSLRGDLEALLGGFAAALSTSPAAALTAALIDAAERDPDFAELHHRETRRRQEPVRLAFERAAARGELRHGVEVNDAVELVSGALFHRRFFSAGTLDEDFASRITELVLRAVTDPENAAP
ncbi:MAG: TetR/AcrR family transcriptional regulator [Proteobacteria bacterium]|nr:TetR/AcrR family transcriptional regulator [Pseudomonadota bacterium]